MFLGPAAVLLIVTVCVFVVSILFWFPQRTHYFWRVFRFLFMEHKQYESWHLKKMIKFTFKDVSTKNSEPTYWTILFVMPKMYFIYKVAGKKSIKFNCRLPLRHLLFLSCNYHGVTDRICKQKSRLKCACFLYKIHVTLQCIVVSALEKTSKVNTILKVVIFKHSVILFSSSMIW